MNNTLSTRNGGAASTRLRIAAMVLTWSYAAVLAMVWTLMRNMGDRWWPATLLIFAPRWLWAAPIPLLLCAGLLTRARVGLALVACGILVAWPIMQWIPPHATPTAAGLESALTIFTCNIDGGQFDVGKLRHAIADAAPDVVALQECSDNVDAASVLPDGWFVHADDGFCVGSRYPVVRTRVLARGRKAPGAFAASYVISAAPPVLLYTVHLQTVRKGLEPLMQSGWHELRALRRNLHDRDEESTIAADLVHANAAAAIVAGDFNVPTDSAVYRDHWGAFANAFSDSGWGFGYTKYTRWSGHRIDHVLHGTDWITVSAHVGAAVGSDHRPVVARLARIAGGTRAAEARADLRNE